MQVETRIKRFAVYHIRSFLRRNPHASLRDTMRCINRLMPEISEMHILLSFAEAKGWEEAVDAAAREGQAAWYRAAKDLLSSVDWDFDKAHQLLDMVSSVRTTPPEFHISIKDYRYRRGVN